MSSMIRAARSVAAASLAALALIATPALLESAAAAAAPAALPSRSDAAHLRVVDQTAWVAAGQRFTLRIQVDTSRPRAGLALSLTVFSRLTSRSAFDQSLQDRFGGEVMTALPTTPLDRLPTDPTGVVTIQVPSDQRGDPGLDFRGCGAGCNGVYPVRVVLRDRGSGVTLDELSTHLVYADLPSGTARLKVATVLPVHAAPSLRPDGQRHLPPSAAAGLSSLVSALQTDPRVPLSLLPTPETLQALGASPNVQDRTTLTGLERLSTLPTDEVLTSSFVPVDVAALDDAGLDSELSSQLARGAQIATSSFGTRSDRTIWVTTGAVDSGALDQLSGRSFGQLVLPDSDLAATASKLTETAAFSLYGRSSRPVLALAADSGLGAHFVNGADPVLSAHQLLADLAMIFFDQPNARGPRAVVAESPLSWTPDASFLQAMLTGLSTSPMVEPVTLGAAFHSFSTPSAPVRHLASPSSTAPALPSGRIRSSRAKLDAFASAIGGPDPLVSGLGDLLLVSESANMTTATRDSYLGGSDDALSQQIGLISLPVDRTVTLTARTARIPITIISGAPYRIHATLSVTSQQLSFPNGSTKDVVLDHRTNAEYFDVRSRSSGAFPLRVSLVSPEGGLVLVNGHFTVRSTAASGVAIALSIGAAVFLLAWWMRSALTGRRERNRRLVPSDG